MATDSFGNVDIVCAWKIMKMFKKNNNKTDSVFYACTSNHRGLLHDEILAFAEHFFAVASKRLVLFEIV